MAQCNYKLIVLCLLFYTKNAVGTISCETGYCRNYIFDEGCSATSNNCRINNSTHTGLVLPSPTTCNCCDFCLPFIGEGNPCSVGGPGTGTTVGRCGDGLTCVQEADGNYCRRMETACHNAQDDYDERHTKGEIGALEMRPLCDGKGNYAPFDCIPGHTCFCQSEKGERLFGEALYLGSETMHCGCSRMHETIRSYVSYGVPYPVVGPRCTARGDYNPVQCVGRQCYCVNRITGVRTGDQVVDLDEDPITELSCYDATQDLFPSQSLNGPPYNYTTPCLETMDERIELLEQSEAEGFDVTFHSTVPECMPDGTYGRITRTRNGTKICVDEWGLQIENFEAQPYTDEFENMDCKCAQTRDLMSSSTERPMCCRNGNYRPIQCRRGQCRCVDSDGRQTAREASNVESLPCYTEEWKDC